jgi:hypothetical protein
MADSVVVEPHGVSPKNVPIRPSRRVLGSLGVIALFVGALFAFSLSAGAVEFDPIPKVTSSQQCVDGGLLVSILMTNEGAGTATFLADWNDTLDGNIQDGGLYSFDVADNPGELSHTFPEGHEGTITITSTDGPGVDFSLKVPAVDCQSNPEATVAVICPSFPGEVPRLEYTYQNDSQVPVDFTFVDSYGPDIMKTGVKNMADPAIESKPVFEDVQLKAEAFADGVLLDGIDAVVDCSPPNQVTVSKIVVGGTGNPAFNFEVVCHPNDLIGPDTVVDTFSLHDGESKSVDLPVEYQVCNAHEIGPGAGWTVSETLNGSPIDSAFDAVPFPNGQDHTLVVTNTAKVEPTTTTSTVIPSTTTPAPTTTPATTSTTNPATTTPLTTTPATTTPATTSTPPAAVRGAAKPRTTAASSVASAADPMMASPRGSTPVLVPPAAAPPAARQVMLPAPAVPAQTRPLALATTGSDNGTLLFAGLVLFIGGLAMVGATRRSRRSV